MAREKPCSSPWVPRPAGGRDVSGGPSSFTPASSALSSSLHVSQTVWRASTPQPHLTTYPRKYAGSNQPIAPTLAIGRRRPLSLGGGDPGTPRPTKRLAASPTITMAPPKGASPPQRTTQPLAPGVGIMSSAVFVKQPLSSPPPKAAKPSTKTSPTTVTKPS